MTTDCVLRMDDIMLRMELVWACVWSRTDLFKPTMLPRVRALWFVTGRFLFGRFIHSELIKMVVSNWCAM